MAVSDYPIPLEIGNGYLSKEGTSIHLRTMYRYVAEIRFAEERDSPQNRRKSAANPAQPCAPVYLVFSNAKKLKDSTTNSGRITKH